MAPHTPDFHPMATSSRPPPTNLQTLKTPQSSICSPLLFTLPTLLPKQPHATPHLQNQYAAQLLHFTPASTYSSSIVTFPNSHKSSVAQDKSPDSLSHTQLTIRVPSLNTSNPSTSLHILSLILPKSKQSFLTQQLQHPK